MLIGHAGRVGHRVAQGHTLPGVGPPGHKRFELRRVKEYFSVELGALIGVQGRPVLHRCIPRFTLGCVGTPLHVVKRRLIRCDNSRARTRFDGHVANGHPTVHAERSNSATAVFEHVPLPAAGTNFCDDRQDDVFGTDARRELALDVDGHRFEWLQGQSLGGQHVLDFAGADSKRHGAEGAVGRGVGIATDDCHPGHRQSQLRSHHVHDALFDIAQGVKSNPELFTVRAQRLDLDPRGGLRDGFVDVDRGGVVVFGRDGEVRPANNATGLAKAIKGLWAGDFVNQVKVNVEQVGFALGAAGHKVVIPQLLGESTWSHSNALLSPNSRLAPLLAGAAAGSSLAQRCPRTP